MTVSKHLRPTEKSQVTCDFEQPLSEDVKLTVWAVDGAVLKLANYILESPHEYFTNKKLQYKANASLEGMLDLFYWPLLIDTQFPTLINNAGGQE
jgi:hypothetical protein